MPGDVRRIKSYQFRAMLDDSGNVDVVHQLSPQLSRRFMVRKNGLAVTAEASSPLPHTGQEFRGAHSAWSCGVLDLLGARLTNRVHPLLCRSNGIFWAPAGTEWLLTHCTGS